MQDIHTLVTRYLDAFNEADADHRRELLGALYTPQCTYTDPHVDLQGADQVEGFIVQTQERFPGFTFTLGGTIDAHHNQARFQWHAGPDDEPDKYVGFDLIVTEDGRIRNVYGFMDATPTS
jgi:SnoaL-like domain